VYPFTLQYTKDSSQELDRLLILIENPIRRSIIKRLSQEPSYPLQLSKELGVGQQLIAKHLDILEEAGLVSSSMEHSPSGPDRKEYVLKKSIAMTIDFAPNLYSARLVSQDLESDEAIDRRSVSSLLSRIDKIINSAQKDGKISSIAKVISEVDRQILSLEDQRVSLLYVRNIAMKEASKILRESDHSLNSRRVLYHILDSQSRDVSDISESLNLREEVVRRILQDIESEVKV
jgi:ArsR family transcriptional regulator